MTRTIELKGEPKLGPMFAKAVVTGSKRKGRTLPDLEVVRRDVTPSVADVADYDAVFYPGGHGPMEDLAYDQDSAKLLQERIDSGRALSLVCHAPAALLALDNDNWPLKGYTMTGFTNAEEGEETIAAAKWVVETRLRELGADFKQTDPMQPYVEVDRNLYTGQNPASSEPLAQRILRDF